MTEQTIISTHILTKRMTISLRQSKNTTRYFNSHPHEEDDSFPLQYFPVSLYFNSHPHEEDDNKKVNNHHDNKYFNSHPHEEDDIWISQ